MTLRQAWRQSVGLIFLTAGLRLGPGGRNLASGVVPARRRGTARAPYVVKIGPEDFKFRELRDHHVCG